MIYFHTAPQAITLYKLFESKVVLNVRGTWYFLRGTWYFAQNRMLVVMDGSGEAQKPFFWYPPFLPLWSWICQYFANIALYLVTEAFFSQSEENKSCLELKITPENCPDLPRLSFWTCRERCKGNISYSKFINILHKQPSSSSHKRFLAILKKRKLV